MMFKFFITLLVSFFLTFNVHSAVKTWDGGGRDNNWQTSENWIDNIAPTIDDDLVFPANPVQTNIINDYDLFTNFNSITIEGGDYTISGNPFYISNGLIVANGTNTIDTAITLLSPQTFVAGQGSTTTIAALDFSGFNFEIAGNGSFSFGLITGTGNLEKSGSGSSMLTTATNYIGAINIYDGILVIDANIPNSPVLVNANPISGEFGRSGLGGIGTVGETSIINGRVKAGNSESSAGILTTNGNFNIAEHGIVEVKIGGSNPGEYDQFKVDGTVTLNNSRLTPISFNSFQSAIGDLFIIVDNDETDPINGTFLNAPEGALVRGDLNTSFSISYVGGDGNDIVIKRVSNTNFDFDGDGKSDISNFNPSDGTWNILQSSNSRDLTIHFGLAGDKITSADFDGDSKTDYAVFRSSNGVWYILNSSDFSVDIVQFGLDGDIPIPNDFDGDGRADLGLFRPSEGIWYQLRSLGHRFYAQQFGTNGDVPLMGDYDGDGIGDLAIYRDGFWHLLRSSDDSYMVIQLGISTDIPIPGDYDGDNLTDFAVFRGTEGSEQPDFYILHGGDFSFAGAAWGVPEDIPVVADYDGDGRTDIAVFRPSTNIWYLLQSTNGFSAFNFGSNGNKPVASAFLP